MKTALREYLYFSRSQRRAIIGILILVLIISSVHFYIGNQPSEEIQYQLALLEKMESGIVEKDRAKKKEIAFELFNFDPNIIGVKDWMKLGLSEKQAQAILNYRSKGGKFRVKDDLSKMYTISEDKFEELKPFIDLPDEIEVKEERRDPQPFVEEVGPILIDLNSADSVSLMKLSGIGPTYSSRIIKYRKLLGGFYSIDQLDEVWGLRDSTIKKIRPNLSLAKGSWRMININSTGEKELASHPYIDWNTAKAIVNYREQHGPFQKIEDLKKIYILNDSLLSRIFPYLAID